MDWSDLRVFCAAAQAPTLGAAARRLRLSVATVSRRLDSLEAATGLRLLERTTTGVELTAAGRALQARALAAQEAMVAAERAAATLRDGAWPDPIRVSATEPVIAEILAPAVPALVARHPGLRIDLAVASEVVSLAARDAEVALRLAPPAGDSLVARRLPGLRFGLYAGRPWLAGRDPATVDLKAAPFVTYDDSYGDIPERAWLARAGFSGQVVARSGSTRALAHMVAAGAGLAILPQLVATRLPGLVALQLPRPIPDRTAWLVTHRDLARTAPVRAVTNWAAAAYRGAVRAAVTALAGPREVSYQFPGETSS